MYNLGQRQCMGRCASSASWPKTEFRLANTVNGPICHKYSKIIWLIWPVKSIETSNDAFSHDKQPSTIENILHSVRWLFAINSLKISSIRCTLYVSHRIVCCLFFVYTKHISSVAMQKCSIHLVNALFYIGYLVVGYLVCCRRIDIAKR